MIKELKMVATKDLIHLVDRFAMYDTVFNEYLDTIMLIDEGKALMFENFQSLSRNYRKNVQVFAGEALHLMKTLTDKLDTHSLQKIATGLSNYINELNGAITCVDLREDSVDTQEHGIKVSKILKAKNELCYSIKEVSFI